MDTEPYIILSFIFNRSGKSKLKKSEIYLTLSLDLSWFTTEQSKHFVDYSIQQKLLLQEDGLLSPNFNVEKVKIPIGFIPLNKEYKFEKKEIREKNIIDEIVNKIVDNTKKSPEEIFNEIKKNEQEKNILPEVAVLLVAKKYNVKISEYYDKIESVIIENGE